MLLYLSFSFQNGEYSFNSYAYTNTRNLENKQKSNKHMSDLLAYSSVKFYFEQWPKYFNDNAFL